MFWRVPQCFSGLTDVPQKWLSACRSCIHIRKPVSTRELTAHKSFWRGYKESLCNWKLWGDFFFLFSDTQNTYQTGAELFFWNVQLCETCLVSVLHRNLEPSCFHPNKFKLKNLLTKLGAYLHQETDVPNSLTYKCLVPVELTKCASPRDWFLSFLHFTRSWLSASTVPSMRWAI